jgi:predicted dehydrogenase
MTQSSTTLHALRYAIAGGAGGIAKTHINALARLSGAQVVALCDIDAGRGKARASEVGCTFFIDHRQMLDEAQPDVVVICTPHPSHATIAIDSLRSGAHVLTEKPMAIEVAEADAMIEAAERAERILVVNFQQRFRPIIEFARDFIASGQLGELVRVACIEPWYRPAAYYRSAAWRGSWRGEGGGVLMNQAPHTLDLLCHLAGMPVKVWGWTRTRHHAIECEDSAQAMLEFANGAPGVIQVNTTEAGARQRLEIVGDCAALELNGDTLTITHFELSLSEYRRTSDEMFGQPKAQTEKIELPSARFSGDHLALHRDLADAIAEGRTPRIDGYEGRMSLELANAITLSNHIERAVTLPLDRAAYSWLLRQLQAL